MRSKNMYGRLKRVLWALVAVGIVIGSIGVLFNEDTYNGDDKDGNFFPGMKMFEYRLVLVLTGSMLPKIQINSISMLEYCDIEDVNLGDIIMYKNPNTGVNITHRVVNVKYDNEGNKYVLTRGDANSVVDTLTITDKELVGKLIYTINGVAPVISIFVKDGNINYINFIFVLSVCLLIILMAYVIIDEVINILVLTVICNIPILYDDYIQSYDDTICRNIDMQKYLKFIQINKSDNIIQRMGKIYKVERISQFHVESIRVSLLMDKYNKRFRKGAK